MVRPRRYKSVAVTSFYYPQEASEVIEKAKELAKLEGITFSELIVKALHEYVERHYPGNPQIPLTVFTKTSPKAKTLEAKIVARDLKKNIESFKRLMMSKPMAYYTVREDMKKNMLKLAKLNEILQNSEYDELIREAEKLLLR